MRTARKLLLAIAGLVVVPGLPGQPESAKALEFAVASVKPHAVAVDRIVVRVTSGSPIEAHVHGDRFADEVTTLSDLIMTAYNVKYYQVLGLPGWAQADYYDIDAKAEGAPTPNQFRLMLQTLLVDRFQLRLHREMKEVPVYALTIGKNGSKLRKIPDDEPVPTYATRPRTRPAVLRSTVQELIMLLSDAVDRPVLDQTGLAGTYEYKNLDWWQLGRELRAATPDSQSGPSVFAAVQEELGLKLEARKDRVEVLIVDRAEKPTEN